MKFNWTCPFCHHDAVVFDGQNGTISNFSASYTHDGKYPNMTLFGQFIGCPNEKCGEFSLTAKLQQQELNALRNAWQSKGRAQHWNLIPISSAKVFPDYIPEPLRADYQEAGLIQELSPKASATLSRRCLQGMIRDFWGISLDTLAKEINALKGKIDTQTWEAIDSVRQVGNIGAHMEKNINVIVDVDPNEAQLLTGLLETLFEEWYIAKHDKEEKMSKIKAIAATKKADRSSLPKTT